MKIYKLTVYEVEPEQNAVISSYVSPRTEKASEFYILKTKAIARQNEIYNGMQALVGFLPKVEARITEIEAIE